MKRRKRAHLPPALKLARARIAALRKDVADEHAHASFAEALAIERGREIDRLQNQITRMQKAQQRQERRLLGMDPRVRHRRWECDQIFEATKEDGTRWLIMRIVPDGGPVGVRGIDRPPNSTPIAFGRARVLVGPA